MADTYDVVTLAEAKATLGVKATSTDRDGRVAQYVTAVSRRLDQCCGAIVTRSVTNERHDGGGTSIRLRHPVSAFASVIEYQWATAVTLTAETVGTAPAEGYYSTPHAPDPTIGSGRLVRRSGAYDLWFYPGRGNVVVSYTAGRYGSTATVDARFKEAAYLMLRNLWGSMEEPTVVEDVFDTPGGRFPTVAVPKAVRALLHDEWREVPGMA